jgi:magnesium-transporting ATPase (P-type)
MQNQNTGRFK